MEPDHGLVRDPPCVLKRRRVAGCALAYSSNSTTCRVTRGTGCPFIAKEDSLVESNRNPKPPDSASEPGGATGIVDYLVAALENEKAEDIACIDLRGKSPLTDHMLIASGRSSRHVRAISEKLAERLKKERGIASQLEGADVCDWVLLDAGDAIVHVFRPEIRAFYDLEKLWYGETRHNLTGT